MTEGGHVQARVLRLITRMNVGGPARQALLLTRALQDSFPTVLAAGASPMHEGELTDPDVPTEAVPLVRPVHPLKDVRAVRSIRSLLSSTRAEILHTHMAKAGAAGRLAALTMPDPPKTVHTFHGHVLDGYFGPVREKLFTEVERYLAGKTDLLIAVSEEVRNDLLEKGIGTEEKVRVVRLGLDLERHLAVDERSGDGSLRRRIGLTADVPLIGIAGRLAPIKDHGTLFEAVSMLPAAHLAVLGDGECRTELEDRASQLGIQDRIHFMGWWTDMPKALGDMDVVALSSLNEGTPVSLIEASACARAVVATAVGGVPDVVEHETTGLLAPPGQPQLLAQALERLLGAPDLRRSMGIAGRSHVRQRYSGSRLVRDITSIYEQLLNG